MRSLYPVLLILLLTTALLPAQEIEYDNLGTEFYLSFPANWEFNAAFKYVRLYILSEVETTVRVSAGPFEKSVVTVPGQVVTVDLANVFAQVFVRNDQSPEPNDKVYPGAAVHIEADDPVIVYGINRTSHTSDGLLILPVHALGTDYVVASAASVEGAGQSLPSQYMVIAPYDSTTVTIINADDTPNNKAGESITVTMMKGDVYSAMSTGFGGDLSGTLIRADKPVAVTAGQNCTYLPDARYPACDHIVEMLTPISTWGRTYHSLPFADRTKGDTYRIFAGESNAAILVNGTLLTTLSTVGGEKGTGWVEYRMEERMPMTFSSNKKITVVQYNNSQRYDNSEGTDPFMMILSPVEQYRSSFTFATPDGDFPKNYLALITDSGSFETWEIRPIGSGDWTRVVTMPGAFEESMFNSLNMGNAARGITISLEPGAYEVRGAGTGTVSIYGGGSFDSYGYPASVGLDVIEGTSDVLDRAMPDELDLTERR